MFKDKMSESLSFANKIIDFIKLKSVKPVNAVKTYCENIANYFKLKHQIKSGAYTDGEKTVMLKKLSEGYRHLFVSTFNVALPIVTGAAALTVVLASLGTTYGLLVSYDGKKVGYISGEDVYYRSISKIGRSLSYSSNNEGLTVVPTLSVCKINGKTLSDAQDISDSILKQSSSVFDEACGLYVDGEFVGAISNETDARGLLEQILTQYKAYYPKYVVEYASDISYVVGLYPTSEVYTAEGLVEKLFSVKAQSNDNDGLTEQIDMGIAKAEKSKAKSIISVGISKTETKKTELDYNVNEIADPNIYVGHSEIKVKGKKGLAENTDMVTYVNGKEKSRFTISSNVIKKAVDEKVNIGTKPSDQVRTVVIQLDKAFIWPLDGGWISSGFCTPDRPTHRGLDIAAAMGTDIYAAASGVVTYSGWVSPSDGGGLVVTVDHGNGFQTRYCHCSVLYVNVGDVVTQGQIIAGVGSTGNSTGPHLHFMVRYNGAWYDPKPFLPDR